MTERHLTPEERKLWRESNRHTRSMQPQAPIPPHAADAEIAAAKSAAINAPPPPEPRARRVPSARLLALSNREAARRLRTHPVEATLDLHGLSKLDARETLQQFLLRHAQAHRRHVVIITGKGKSGAVGVLREFLPDWLNEAPLRAFISAIAYAAPEKGGVGVMHVLLKVSKD